MERQSRAALISAIPLFENLNTRIINSLADKVSEHSFVSGELLVGQGQQGDRAYIIVSGSVKVYRISEEGEEIHLAMLGPNEIVGELALIDSEPRSAYAQAIQPTHTLILTQKDFSRILSAHPQMAINLLKTLSRRIRALNEQMEDILTKNLTDRTLKALKVLSKLFENGEIALSHEELATIIGATRARVTEVLDQLKKENKISLAHKRILLL